MPRLIQSPFFELPDTIDGCVKLLDEYSIFVHENSARGAVLRECYKRIKEVSDIKLEKAEEDSPLAFRKVSYEQALKLNCWIWGINFVCDFDANRIGKTAGTIIGVILWIFPNNPEWKIFKPYIDKWGRLVHVLQRPTIQYLVELQDFFAEHPEMRGDPMKGLDDPDNAKKFASLQKRLPKIFRAAWPEPSFTSKRNVAWLGAPDIKYHEEIVRPEWRKWLPKANIVRDSDHDLSFSLQVGYKTRFGQKREINWELLGKSYGSEDTKWSGAAVRGILLTEGFTNEILNEIKQRFQEEAFAGWDYTPYEARNTGKRSSLAHRVFQRKEELPLPYHVFHGFGIEKCPDFILPPRKRAALMRMWEGKPQGKARIYGKFYSDSPQALSNFDREFHCVPWSVEELFKKFPTGIKCRSLDLGYDHPTVCLWGLLAPDNTWYIYRCFSEAGLSIGERVKKIIECSNNSRYHHKCGKNSDDFYWVEYHPKINSEVYLPAIADYHLFKTDETNGQPYIRNYIKEGLIIRESTHMKPNDRANEVNRLLEKSNFRAHPETRVTPGSKIFFLINGEGVSDAIEKLENLFWARYLQGERIGTPKDELQSHDDDEFDALSYLTLSTYRWSPNVKLHRKELPETYDSQFFTRQLKLAA